MSERGRGDGDVVITKHGKKPPVSSNDDSRRQEQELYQNRGILLFQKQRERVSIRLKGVSRKEGKNEAHGNYRNLAQESVWG